MKLIIAEKPSLAKTIAAAIGNEERKDGYIQTKDYIVSWAFGHLFELYSIDDYIGEKKKWKDVALPYFPTEMKFQLKNDPGVKKQFKILKDLEKRQDVVEIINCGDADREGQIIVDLILKDIGTKKKITRLWLPEQTEETIRDQLKVLKDNSNYRNLHNEGLARTYIDWLYGINLTRYITLKAGTMFPAGRVLIPIVKHIYDRDLEIRNFKPKKYFVLESSCSKNKDEFKLSLNKFKYENNELDMANKEAERLNKYKAIVNDVQNKEVIKKAPKLFSLSKLQSKLSKDLKISFGDSMVHIQSLYEKGLITYPRTNTEYLSENEKVKVEKLINHFKDYNLKMKDNKSIFDDSKIESHSAIIPTTKTADITGVEKQIYDTVLNRFLSVFCAEETIINQTIVNISVAEEKFILKGESLKQEGFLKYEPMNFDNKLPVFLPNEQFEVNFKPIEKTTTAPKKITESSLSSFLKNPFRTTNDEEIEAENIDDTEEYKDILKGVEIGTEATRTGIIENAIKYDYITRDKQNFSITKKGEYFIEALDKLEIDLYKEKTVETSQLQKEVLNGTKTIDECMKIIKENIKDTINKDIKIEAVERNIDKEVIGICPKCSGNIFESKKNYYCENYKRENPCKFSLWKENKYLKSLGTNLTKTDVKNLLSKGKFKKKCKSKAGKDYEMEFNIVFNGDFVNFEGNFVNKSSSSKK